MHSLMILASMPRLFRYAYTALLFSAGSGSFSSFIDQIRNNHIAGSIEYDVYKGYAVRAIIHIYDTTMPTEHSADITVDFGKDPSKSDHMTITASSAAAPGQTYVIDYRINTNTKESYQSTLNVTGGGMTVASVNFTWNKTTGDFTCSVSGSGIQAVTITGNAKIDGQIARILAALEGRS